MYANKNMIANNTRINIGLATKKRTIMAKSVGFIK
jgi:hypothetical protein